MKNLQLDIAPTTLLKPFDLNPLSDAPTVSNIQLIGTPYVQDHHDLNVSLDMLAVNTNYQYRLQRIIEEHADTLFSLKDTSFFSHIDRSIKAGGSLSFEEAFCASVFVAARTNMILKEALEYSGITFPEMETHKGQSVMLLQGLSMKEALVGLNSNEIAGLVSGVLALDTVVRLPMNGKVLCFGGMGGDKGYGFVKQSKLFSLSTLAAFASSLYGLTHKHHSYPNTSKVAGQTTLEEFGARSDFTCTREMRDIFNKASLIMTSCHNTRTIHSLSHVLKGETINHLIGPLAYTIDKDTEVQPFIGVNEKVHPQTLIEAILKIDERGIQKYDCGVVFCGLSDAIDDLSEEQKINLTDDHRYYADYRAKDLVRLDEVAPPPFATLAGFFSGGKNLGNYLIAAEDFFPKTDLINMALDDLLIPNAYDDIISANHTALDGNDDTKARYLAMTIGLANFTRFSLDDPHALNPTTKRVNTSMLRAHTAKAYDDLKSGAVHAKMKDYCSQTQRITSSMAYRAK